MTDPIPYHDLACAVVQQGVDMLKAHHAQQEIDFFTDPAKSEVWCVAAGLDWDATVSRLRHDGHLVATPPPLRRKDFLPLRG